jgi:hypothetical protein
MVGVLVCNCIIKRIIAIVKVAVKQQHPSAVFCASHFVSPQVSQLLGCQPPLQEHPRKSRWANTDFLALLAKFINVLGIHADVQNRRQSFGNAQLDGRQLILELA